MDESELTMIAMKELWCIEGQIICWEAYLDLKPDPETIIRILRDLRERRKAIEEAVENLTDVRVEERRLRG